MFPAGDHEGGPAVAAATSAKAATSSMADTAAQPHLNALLFFMTPCSSVPRDFQPLHSHQSRRGTRLLTTARSERISSRDVEKGSSLKRAVFLAGAVATLALLVVGEPGVRSLP